jgi:hypothetical protein
VTDGVEPRSDFEFFAFSATSEEVSMTTMTAQEFAAKLNVSDIWVRELARAGRIYPARKHGKQWMFFGNSQVIRPLERSGRAPQKMILPHEELSMKQMMREMRYNLDNEF